MATPRRTAAALAAAALTLTLAACSASPGNPADAPGSDETSLGRDGLSEAASPAPRPTAAGEAAQTVPPAPSDGAEATVAPADGTDLPSLAVQTDGTEIVVVVGPVRRTGGDLADLTVTVHLVGGYGAQASTLVGSLEESELIDTENGRVHRVARDRDEVCVCSRVGDVYLSLDDAMVLSATFAAPPRDVDEVDVRLTLGGTFSGVPVV
ncbi:hypothetical protein [Nocardiopsis sp. CC223A]|uniref:hypothetical protein n=1 Tax=Nocardiopsis sp. CC223A TaxID=3044051 RepID=UPI00278BB46E|nr:hypothetical protein [Nocardiopsis sp. CC223A]